MARRNITVVNEMVKTYSEYFENVEFHYLRVFGTIVAEAIVTGSKVKVFVTFEEKTITTQHYIDQFRNGFRQMYREVETKHLGYMAMKRASNAFMREYAETQNPNALMMGSVFVHDRANEFEGAFKMLTQGTEMLP